MKFGLRCRRGLWRQRGLRRRGRASVFADAALGTPVREAEATDDDVEFNFFSKR